MGVMTYEAVVENGQIRLPESVRLPEHSRVYVLVTGLEVEQSPTFRVGSPRLENPRLAADFAKEVAVESADDTL